MILTCARNVDDMSECCFERLTLSPALGTDLGVQTGAVRKITSGEVRIVQHNGIRKDCISDSQHTVLAPKE